MNLFRQILAVSIAFTLIVAAGCSSGSKDPGKTTAPAGSAPNTKKDIVTVALSSDQPTLDPHMHNERNAIIVNWHIFDSLLTRNPDTMDVIPHLAESFAIIDDLTWEFKLRKDVKFHNGEDFNADVVKFSFDRVLNEAQKSPQRGNISAVSQVEIVDPYTVRLITSSPYPLLAERLTYFSMVPPKYLTEAGDDKFAVDPIGTGPYKFKQWVKGERIILEANESYWKGAPAIKTAIFRAIPEQATQLNELAAGGIDIIRQLVPDLVPQVEKGGNRVESAAILRVWHISMNHDTPPYNDKNFRLAFLHALDVDLIIKEIFQGQATRVPALVNPRQFGFDASVKAPKFDPELAKNYLAQSQYKGETLVLHHYMTGAGQAVMDAIQADLKKVGINAEIKYYPDTSALVALTRAGTVPLNGGTWGSFSTFDADAVLEPFFHMGGAYGKFHQFNPNQNQWVEEGRSTLDPAMRQAAYSKLQKALVEEAWDISLFAPMDIYGINKDLNYKPRADEIVYLYDASWK